MRTNRVSSEGATYCNYRILSDAQEKVKKWKVTKITNDSDEKIQKQKIAKTLFRLKMSFLGLNKFLNTTI